IHAAIVFTEVYTGPARFGELTKGALVSLGRCHATLLNRTPYAISYGVEWCQNSFSKRGRLLNNRGNRRIVAVGAQFLYARPVRRDRQKPQRAFGLVLIARHRAASISAACG